MFFFIFLWKWCRLTQTIFILNSTDRIIRRNYKSLADRTTDEDINELEKLIEKQNLEYFDIYDQIAKHLPKKDQLEILKLNGQFVPEAKSEVRSTIVH